MNIDAVLIDDNPWIRELWESHGQKIGRIFRTCASFVEFINVYRHIDRKIPIFVDLRLGDKSEVNGKGVIRNLSSLGFESLFLATAYRVNESPAEIGVRAVVGKEPPDWLKSAERSLQIAEAGLDTRLPASLTATEKKLLRQQMDELEIERFNSRISKLYDAMYMSESVDFTSTPPAIVLQAWEDAIYRGLNDEELKNQIDLAWRQSFDL